MIRRVPWREPPTSWTVEFIEDVIALGPVRERLGPASRRESRISRQTTTGSRYSRSITNDASICWVRPLMGVANTWYAMWRR